MSSRPRTLLAKAGQLSDSRRVKPKPAELPPEQQPITPITLSVNTVLDGKFILAGDPLPVSSADDLPESLKPFAVTTANDEPEEADDVARANYQLGVVYQVNSDGRLGRALRRQADRLEEENALRDWAEERLSEPLPREVADALQDQHDQHIGASKAKAQYVAEERDQAQEVAQKFIDGEDQEVNL